MIERPTPREIPDRHPYVRLELAGEDPTFLKIPSALAVAKIVKDLDRLHMAALASMQSAQGGNPINMVAMLKEAGPEIGSVLGALIGKAWADPTHDLVTDAADHPSAMAYGEAVFEELHDDGWTLDHILGVGLTVIRAVWESSQLTDEVSKRAGFFFPLMASTPSPESTSGAPTSGTRGDSTD